MSLSKTHQKKGTWAAYEPSSEIVEPSTRVVVISVVSVLMSARSVQR